MVESHLQGSLLQKRRSRSSNKKRRGCARQLPRRAQQLKPRRCSPLNQDNQLDRRARPRLCERDETPCVFPHRAPLSFLRHIILKPSVARQQVAARRARARVEEAELAEASRVRKRAAEQELADAVEGAKAAAAAVPAARKVPPSPAFLES